MNERAYPRRAGTGGLNVALGIWVLISPFVLGFVRDQPAKWNNIAVGIAVVLFALGGGSWWNLILGLWLIASPFALGFANAPTMLWNNVILGALVALVAILSRPARAETYAGTPPAGDQRLP